VDDTVDFGAGLSWAPSKMMNIDLMYNFEDFSSDDITVENFQENRGTIMVTLYPTAPPRMLSRSTGIRSSRGSKESNSGGGTDVTQPATALDRTEVDSKIFNTNKIKER